jgi:hypothetical protein
MNFNANICCVVCGLDKASCGRTVTLRVWSNLFWNSNKKQMETLVCAQKTAVSLQAGTISKRKLNLDHISKVIKFILDHTKW